MNPNIQDGKVRGYLPDVEDPLFQLDGHTENVTSLYLSKFGTLISGAQLFPVKDTFTE